MPGVLAGGGIKRGAIIGKTDDAGAKIVYSSWSGNRPICMEDIACTIYSALGIDWTKKIDRQHAIRTGLSLRRAGFRDEVCGQLNLSRNSSLDGLVRSWSAAAWRRLQYRTTHGARRHMLHQGAAKKSDGAPPHSKTCRRHCSWSPGT